jgi:hypothetical protein
LWLPGPLWGFAEVNNNLILNSRENRESLVRRLFINHPLLLCALLGSRKRKGDELTIY